MPTPQPEYRTKAAKSRAKDLTGQTFGRLTVLSRAGNDPKGKALWSCQCSCSPTQIRIVLGASLQSGNTKSCSCLKMERLVLRVTTHGQTRGRVHSPTYVSWASMINRCTDPKSIVWKHYGGRGVTVCPEWLSFENFFVDNGPRPLGKNLDRIDNEKGYYPGNTRWVPQGLQCQNQRLRSDNKTGVKGVTIHHSACYRASITIDRKQKHLGYFPLTPEGLEAAKAARKLAEDIYWGVPK